LGVRNGFASFHIFTLPGATSEGPLDFGRILNTLHPKIDLNARIPLEVLEPLSAASKNQTKPAFSFVPANS
jgi:hypothetical protein